MVPKSNVASDITYNNVYDIAYDNVSNVVSNVGIFNRAHLKTFQFQKCVEFSVYWCSTLSYLVIETNYEYKIHLQFILVESY